MRPRAWPVLEWLAVVPALEVFSFPGRARGSAPVVFEPHTAPVPCLAAAKAQGKGCAGPLPPEQFCLYPLWYPGTWSHFHL